MAGETRHGSVGLREVTRGKAGEAAREHVMGRHCSVGQARHGDAGGGLVAGGLVWQVWRDIGRRVYAGFWHGRRGKATKERLGAAWLGSAGEVRPDEFEARAGDARQAGLGGCWYVRARSGQVMAGKARQRAIRRGVTRIGRRGTACRR